MRTHKVTSLFVSLAFSLSSVVVLTSCGGGGTGSGGNAPSSNFSSALSGIAMKGPVENASIRLYTLNADGSRSNSAVSGPFTTEITDVNVNNNVPGRWSSSQVDDFSALEVAARGGYYFDESSGTRVDLTGRELLSFKPKSTKTVAITPITHALLLQAKAQMSKGTPPNDALNNVINDAQATFGFNVIKTQPSDPLATSANLSSAAQKYTALLGGISRLLDADLTRNPTTKLAAFNNANRFDLVIAFSQDLADGVLDGKNVNGKTIQVNNGLGQSIAFPVLSSNGISIDSLFSEAHTFAQLDSNLSAALSTNFPGKALNFGNNNTAFAPQVAANNGDRLHPLISWTGSAKSIFVIRENNSAGQSALGAWNVAVNSGGFNAPVTYFTAPQGAFTRTQNMSSNGAGEANLTVGIAYQITVILVDGTVGSSTYTP